MEPTVPITAADETLKGKTMFASLHTSTMTVRRVQSRGIIDRLTARLRLATIAYSQRQHLASLDDHALADIGLTRAQAHHEANRPVWDVPKGWRC